MTDLSPERAVIAIGLRTPAALDDVDLAPEDFHDLRLGALWGLIATMRDRGEPVTPTSVAAALPRVDQSLRQGIDERVIGDIYSEIVVGAQATYYAGLVSDAAVRRRLQIAATRIAQLADSGADPAVIVETARAEVDATSRDTAQVSIVAERIDQTLAAYSTPSRAVPTPWPSLDKLIDGWRPGALYVVGARPGVGKTILGVEAAIGLARFGPVAFSSLEMPEAELHSRIVANLAEVSIGRLDRRELTEEDHRKIRGARARMDLPISIDDRGLATTVDVRSHARSLSRRGHLAGVVVDYLQLMSSPRGDRRPRHEVVAGFSRDLKLLAKELDCPVIALSQLNRGSADRADKRPALSDLRESGAVEQDSDVVLLLHENEDDETDLNVFVAKNRHGPRGSVNLIRRGWYSSLTEHTWSE
ncbi:MAG: AAA family ATPase [Salana multivorans]|uniref:replicative DNA helicase n=1 Tax=Salana multivorans TaxID=120377 RepID=UPI00095E11C2|nr:DnaB-like helicase C-terminal domain-containing protein [Salana multivorans]MBN8882979.1 AAA family ATPase [Salana multivorans]OJX94067.1 MAG: hypothetical protein BGO96_09680 [Micrococcales bacterium 73-15]